MAVSLRMAAVAFSPDPHPSGLVETGAALPCRAGAWPAGCSVAFPMQIVKELRRVLRPACRLDMSPCRAPCPQGAGLPGFHRLRKDGAFCRTGDPVSPYGNFHFCYEIYSEVLRGGGVAPREEAPPGGVQVPLRQESTPKQLAMIFIATLPKSDVLTSQQTTPHGGQQHKKTPTPIHRTQKKSNRPGTILLLKS